MAKEKTIRMTDEARSRAGRGIHTAYVPDPDAPKQDSGHASRFIGVPFLTGRRDQVDSEAVGLVRKAHPGLLQK